MNRSISRRPPERLSRREFVGHSVMAAAGALVAGRGSDALPPPPGAEAAAARTFPSGFLWGAATAAHQVEGNNLNNDWWKLEHDAADHGVQFSGDADDSYHRYGQDMVLLAEHGFNAYRFSIEWARIEP